MGFYPEDILASHVGTGELAGGEEGGQPAEEAGAHFCKTMEDERVMAVGDTDPDAAGPCRKEMDKRFAREVRVDNPVPTLFDDFANGKKVMDDPIEARQMVDPGAALQKPFFKHAALGDVDDEIEGDIVALEMRIIVVDDLGIPPTPQGGKHVQDPQGGITAEIKRTHGDMNETTGGKST